MNSQDMRQIHQIRADVMRNVNKNYMRDNRRKTVGMRSALPNIQLRKVDTNVYPIPEED